MVTVEVSISCRSSDNSGVVFEKNLSRVEKFKSVEESQKDKDVQFKNRKALFGETVQKTCKLYF